MEQVVEALQVNLARAGTSELLKNELEISIVREKGWSVPPARNMYDSLQMCLLGRLDIIWRGGMSDQIDALPGSRRDWLNWRVTRPVF